MASLWKHPESKFWTACFTDTQGRRCKRSTRTTDRRLAQKLANQFEAASRAKRTAQQTQRVIAELHELITGEALTTGSMREFVKSWLATKEPEIAASTLLFYRNASSKFLNFLGDLSDASITEITRKNVTDFRNAESKQVSSKTVNHDLKCLRMIFKASKRDGYIAEDPTEFVETIKQRGSKATKRAFTVPELQTVLSVADEEWRSMVLFGLYTGQRLGDIANMTWQNIDLQREEIHLVTAKIGKRLITPIATTLQKHPETLPTNDLPNEPLHPRAFKIVHKQGKSGNLSNQFADLLAAAGLREKKTHRKISTTGRRREMDVSGLSFHSLHHTPLERFK